MTEKELVELLREYKELKALAAQIGDELADMEDVFKYELMARGTESLTVGVYKIRWTDVTSQRFDTTAFRSAMPDLAKLYTKTTVCRRFTVA